MAITAVGTIHDNNGAGITASASLTPATVGDCFLLAIKVSSGSITVSSVASSNCTWTYGGSYTSTGTVVHMELWIGVATSTSAAAASVTFSSSNSGVATQITAQAFTNGSGAGTTWAFGTTGGAEGTGTTLTAPSLTATAGEGYIAYVWVGNTGSAGSTTGYTYQQMANGNWIVDDPSCTSGAQSPTMTQSPSGFWTILGGLFTATAPFISRASGFPANGESTGLSSLTIHPQHVGDLVVVSTNVHSQTISVTGITGGNVGTWQRAYRYVDTLNGVITEELWWGIATATGSSAFTITWSASVSGITPELVCDSFTTSSTVSWSVYSSGGNAQTAVTTVDFPSLQSNASPEQLYWGYSEETTAGVAGSTTGFTYNVTGSSNLFCYNDTIGSVGTYQPTGTLSSGNTTSIAAVFDASRSGPPPVRLMQAVNRASRY